jgi:hypothetical protein
MAQGEAFAFTLAREIRHGAETIRVKTGENISRIPVAAMQKGL